MSVRLRSLLYFPISFIIKDKFNRMTHVLPELPVTCLTLSLLTTAPFGPSHRSINRSALLTSGPLHLPLPPPGTLFLECLSRDFCFLSLITFTFCYNVTLQRGYLWTLLVNCKPFPQWYFHSPFSFVCLFVCFLQGSYHPLNKWYMFVSWLDGKLLVS